MLTKRCGVVHAVFECEDCGKQFENYKNAQALAAKHAKQTGHYVSGEVGIAVWYNRPQQARLDHSLKDNERKD